VPDSPHPQGRSLFGAPARYPQGLQDLGDGIHAWLQPNGELGESNAGLVVGDGESLLIDTLWDLKLTNRMLLAMAEHTGRAPIRKLVNTHGDGDHCWGNQLLAGAEIIATRAAAEDMLDEDPRVLRMLRGAGGVVGPLIQRALSLPRAGKASPLSDLSRLPGAGKAAGVAAFTALLQPYDFAGIELTPPTRTFEGALELEFGGRRVQLIEVGPAHTPGDLIVQVPDAGTVFAADLMFVGVTPIMWVGPVERWLAGLDRIAELQPRVVVPGHGPITDLEGVRAMRGYWEFVAREVRERVAGGVTPNQAAHEIIGSPDFARQPFSGWDAPERIVVNAATIARSDRGETGRMDSRARAGLLAAMGELAIARRA
jgi:glyoxylase-like metal-dependent hydrolase (beta-lactamase superfamily II)